MINFLNILAITIAIIYFFGFLFTVLTIFGERVYQKKLSKVTIDKYRDIFVLLPALKEQKIVQSTIDWFRKIDYKGNIKFIIITTEKEELEYSTKHIKEDTTNVVVSKYLKKIKDKRFIHYHYPKTNGNKSSQMNYAIEQIKEQYQVKDEETYISVFDFDSKPELNTFDNLNMVAKYRNNPDAINQVPLCFKNYESFSKSPKKIMLLLYTMHHTIRSCAIEKTKLLICSLTNLKVPQYCMGACMHIKLSTLLANDKFPIFVDDLTLGYRLSIKGANFAYLPSYNYSLIPNKLYDYMNSAVLIFKGISTYLTEIKRARGRNLYGRVKMFIAGSFNIIVFTIIPWFIISYYLYSIITGNFGLSFFLLLAIPYLWCIASYINLMYYGFIKDNKLNSFLAFLVSPIWFFFRPFGFLIYLKRLVVSKILHKEIKYKKTGNLGI